MRIRTNRLDFNRDILISAAIILLGIGLGYFFNDFMDNFRTSSILDPGTFYIVIFLAGLQMGVCMGLIINPDTRVGGMLILSTGLMVMVRWHTSVYSYISTFLVAIVIGVALSILSAAKIAEKSPSYISMATLTVLLLSLFYFIARLFQSGMSANVTVLAALISVFIYLGCFHLVRPKGGLK